jgi:hypothetical protein
LDKQTKLTGQHDERGVERRLAEGVAMRPRPLVLAGVLTGLLTLGPTVPAAAEEDTDTSTLEVTVVGGELQISVESATKNLGTVENKAKGTVVSGSLGEVTVRDNRNAPDGSGWVATATATEMEPRKGPGIPASNIRYTPGTVDKQGTVTVQASKTVTLNRPRAVVTASEISGNNVANWTPTITIKIPPGVVAGTYKGTITHSVL